MSTLKILKVLNNNSVIVSDCDAKGIEYVVLGKGIAFNKKIGEIIKNEYVEKKFIMDSESKSSGLLDLLKKYL